MKELSFHTTNDNWIPGYNSKMDVSYREISICGLSITLNVNTPQGKTSHVTFSDWLEDHQKKSHTSKSDKIMTKIKFKPVSPVLQRNKETQIEIKSKEELEFEFMKLRENDVYLLCPLDFTVRIKTTFDLSKDFHNEPQELYWIQTKDPIIFMLNKDHMQFLGALNDHLKSMSIVHRNIHLRPNGPPKKMPREWWIYAVRAIIEDKKRGTDFSRDPASLIKMKKYIDLYKRQQTIVINSSKLFNLVKLDCCAMAAKNYR